ncbi:hypothetical protein [Streptomyces sp. RKAG290]|uniref:hypothetical protein n=1 Tax=Streptomyces sp. RKAG290 TaxID=2888348 RepID=UPI0020346B9A|nr:hypothetical protein [Streptomyces sp. RKAG290]MCM2413254.1 hypothetical protein [Streptomyces sp. RKAG290]
MRTVEYKSHGLPLESYKLTRSDHRWQKDLEDIRQVAREQVARHLDEVYADPVRALVHQEGLSKAWKHIKSFKETPPHEIMQWRVRLYCGRIATTSCHAENDRPPRSMRCPECGKAPSTIVAFEPIGLAGEPPRAHIAKSTAPSKPSRAELERHITVLEEENNRLRADQTT